MKNTINARLEHIVLASLVAVFLLLPFTTPLAVLAGSHLGHLTAFQAWKEIVIIIVGLLILCAYPLRQFFRQAERKIQIIAWLIFAYVSWTIIWGLCNLLLFDRINEYAFAYALVANLRFLAFFLICLVVASYSPVLLKHWRTLLFAPAAVVVVFGLLQHFVLPPDFLAHLGYGPDTITAYQTVDQKTEYVRLQSSLRGPNPLGVYLVLIILALVATWKRRHTWHLLLLAGSSIVLLYTYSRSAWLGLLAGLAVLAFAITTKRRLNLKIITGIAVGALLFAGTIFALRHENFVQNVLFHTDETSQSPESSNEGRARGLSQASSEVLHDPLGRGPGSAGPASQHNEQPERIAENYYLQIGQETGWIGLGLFLAITVVTMQLLWERRRETLAKILLCSLAGILVINLFSHAWADETIALLWWGLAGIAIATSTRKSQVAS